MHKAYEVTVTMEWTRELVSSYAEGAAHEAIEDGPRGKVTVQATARNVDDPGDHVDLDTDWDAREAKQKVYIVHNSSDAEVTEHETPDKALAEIEQALLNGCGSGYLRLFKAEEVDWSIDVRVDEGG